MSNRAAQFRQEHTGKAVVKRNRHSIHFDLGNGQRRACLTIEPLHYGVNNDQEIDTTWTPASAPWAWKMEASSYKVYALSQLNAGQVLKWVHNSGENITVQPMALNWVNHITDALQQISMPLAVQAQAADNTLTWPGGYGAGRSFSYTIMPRRFVKHLIIASAANLPTTSLQNPYLELAFIINPSSGVSIWMDGAQWDSKTKTNTSKRLEFKLASGEIAWKFDAPVATDADGNVSAGIFQVRKSGNSIYCTVRFPKIWIDTAAYPIDIDPTFTDGYGGDVDTAYDTQVYSGAADTNYGTDTITRYAALTYRSLQKYTLTSLVGATINSATQYLTITTAPSSNATLTIVRILAANSSWTEAGATWNYALATSNRWAGDAAGDGGTDAGCTQSGTDFSSTALGTKAIASGTTGEISFTLDLTEFASQIAANYGWVGYEASGVIFRCATSDHATTGSRPKLVVDYTPAGGVLYHPGMDGGISGGLFHSSAMTGGISG